MVRVFPLNENYKERFCKMFADYYDELGCEEDGAHLAEEYVFPDLLARLLMVDLIEEDGEVCGFCIYQVDEPGNDWCFKDGWGDIRELYIVASKRQNGLGRFLLFTAEKCLAEAGAQSIYALPEGEAANFFAACGYDLTDEVCAELECNVFAKSLQGKSGNCGKSRSN